MRRILENGGSIIYSLQYSFLFSTSVSFPYIVKLCQMFNFYFGYLYFTMIRLSPTHVVLTINWTFSYICVKPHYKLESLSYTCGPI